MKCLYCIFKLHRNIVLREIKNKVKKKTKKNAYGSINYHMIKIGLKRNILDAIFCREFYLHNLKKEREKKICNSRQPSQPPF